MAPDHQQREEPLHGDDLGPAQEPSTRRLLVLVLDMSASMGVVSDGETSAPIGQLDSSLRSYLKGLRDGTSGFRLHGELAICAVVNSDAHFLVAGTPVREASVIFWARFGANAFPADPLVASGNTPLGHAICKSLDVITERLLEYKADGIELAHPPVLLVLSDGRPTDDMSGAAIRAHQMERDGELLIWVAAMRGADVTALRPLVNKGNLVPLGPRIDSFVQLISASMRAAELGSSDAEQIYRALNAMALVEGRSDREQLRGTLGPPPLPFPVMSIDENVQFTVYRPRALPVGAWQTVLAFVHLAEPREPADPDPLAEVRRQAQSLLGADAAGYRDTTSDSTTGVPRESDLTLRLELPGCQVNPPERSFRWEEDVHRETFRVLAPGHLVNRTMRGVLTVFIGSLVVADVRFAVRVVADARAAPPVLAPSTSARPYRHIFASYSHHDTVVVNQVVRLASLLGDSYLRDVTHLRSGEDWDGRLLSMIERADVFQLFWSRHAMRSAAVRREWEHACSLNRSHFVRPTYWETPFPEDPTADLPPPYLRALHFQRLPLEALELLRTPARATLDTRPSRAHRTRDAVTDREGRERPTKRDAPRAAPMPAPSMPAPSMPAPSMPARSMPAPMDLQSSPPHGQRLSSRRWRGVPVAVVMLVVLALAVGLALGLDVSSLGR
jgi:uncharacterized protein YegL